MSSIENWLEKSKPWLLPLNIVLVGTLAFGLGRWSKIEEAKTPVLIENPVPVGDTISPVTKNFVASKNGTKYYYPTCSGAARIKEENKIWFSSANQARGAGYSPAVNCPGL